MTNEELRELEKLGERILAEFYKANHGVAYGMFELLVFAYRLGQKETEDRLGIISDVLKGV